MTYEDITEWIYSKAGDDDKYYTSKKELQKKISSFDTEGKARAWIETEGFKGKGAIYCFEMEALNLMR